MDGHRDEIGDRLDREQLFERSAERERASIGDLAANACSTSTASGSTQKQF
jgi:hypothetical protein